MVASHTGNFEDFDTNKWPEADVWKVAGHVSWFIEETDPSPRIWPVLLGSRWGRFDCACLLPS